MKKAGLYTSMSIVVSWMKTHVHNNDHKNLEIDSIQTLFGVILVAVFVSILQQLSIGITAHTNHIDNIWVKEKEEVVYKALSVPDGILGPGV